MKTIQIILLCMLPAFARLYPQFDGYTPEYPVQAAKEYSSSNIYQQDFLYYCDALLDTHPDVYLNWPQEEFKSQKKTTYEKLKDCKDKNEFENILSRFIVPLRDGHTSVPSQPFSYGSGYPIRYTAQGDSLCIINVTDQIPDLSGKFVESINGFSMAQIREKIDRELPLENSIAAKVTMTYSLPFSGFMKFIGIINSERDSIILKTTSKETVVLYPNSNSKWVNSYKQHPFAERKSALFDYEIIKDKNLCYFQFNAFMDKEIANQYAERLPWWQRYLLKTIRFFGFLPHGLNDYFGEFLDEMIEDMEDNNIHTLIIDLRYNGGGNSVLSGQLLYALGVDKYRSYSTDLRYSKLYSMQYPSAVRDTASKDGGTSDSVSITTIDFSDKIHKRFKGKVFYIIGPSTYSSGIIHSATVKDNKLFPIIGEETMQRPTHFGELLFLRLPNTKTLCRISCKKFHRPDRSRDSDETLYPDIQIHRTFSSVINGTDPAIDWIVNHTDQVVKGSN